MKRIVKYLSFTLILTVFFCLLSGCAQKEKEDDTILDAPVQNIVIVPDDSSTAIGTFTSEGTDKLPANSNELVPVTYYSVNSNSGHVVALSSVLPQASSSDPDKLLELVLDSFGDESITLGVNSITLSDTTCFIDFDETIYSVAAMGRDIEDAVLDAIAQSILDNVEECSKIVYRINQEKYSTVNNSFSLDQVYMDD